MEKAFFADIYYVTGMSLVLKDKGDLAPRVGEKNWHTPPPKPGQCPHTLYTFPSRLGCSSDQDCEDYEKCCTYNCGSVCVAPHYRKKNRFNISPYDALYLLSVKQECECDDDCKRGKKCSFNGCHLHHKIINSS
uniref:WAP domain-containing protein n=1 Tax=Nothobranchius furzeri TaxID=105023 RepID=A0A8C6PH33_NOTFU